jgi:hypothetical protein
MAATKAKANMAVLSESVRRAKRPDPQTMVFLTGCVKYYFATLFRSDLGHGAICSKTPISYTQTCRTFFFHNHDRFLDIIT